MREQANTSRTTANVLLRAACGLGMAVLGGVVAQSATSTSPKLQRETCGAYTVQWTERRTSGDSSESRLELLYKGSRVELLQDAMVGTQFCRDLTGDGVPELMLWQYSGGAHCCSTHTLYSLSVPAKRLLKVHSGHSDTLKVQQLDGRGPLELIGHDWRFAYAYGLSFAGSPALPVVYRYQNGRYVDDTRSFPGLLLGRSKRTARDVQAGDQLYDLAALLVVGKPGEAEAYLRGLPQDRRRWLESYLPEIRQSLSDFGMEDWPQRAGLPEGVQAWGIGGSFSAPGVREYAAVLLGSPQTAPRIKANEAALMLFSPGAGSVSASKALFTLPRLGNEVSRQKWWPVFGVRRASGRMDVVVRDARVGDVRFAPYRLSRTEAVRVQGDALETATGLLGAFTSLATLNVALLDPEAQRTARERASLSAMLERHQSAVQAALELGEQSFDPSRLGAFWPEALELREGEAQRATAVIPVSVGFLDPDQPSAYPLTTRYAFTVQLERGETTWQVASWSLTPLAELEREF